MQESIAHRIKQLRAKLTRAAIDTMLVQIGENRHFLSGFTAEDTLFDESAGSLFITPTDLILATDSRFTLQAENEAPLYAVYRYKDELAKALPELIEKLGTRRLGFESNRLSYAHYTKFQQQLKQAGHTVDLVPTEEMVEGLRLSKEQAEIIIIKKALTLAEKAFQAMLLELQPGVTERQAAWALEKHMRALGADGLSFPTIAAFGSNSALPHAIPGDRPLRAGESILFDWGARLDGYCSDISRTFMLGPPDETFTTVFRTVLEAQTKAIGAIRAGVSSKQIDAVARDHIEAIGFKGRFGHGLGHGVGLAIHEAPRLSPFRDVRLEAGMVVTVEPGIYIPGWGGVRIENMVVVRENGAEVLNELPTDHFLPEGLNR